MTLFTDTFDADAVRHSSCSSSSQMYVLPNMDPSDDVLYDTDNYQDGTYFTRRVGTACK